MSLIRRIANRVLHLMARFLPGATTIRPFLHQLRGVKIHRDVFIGDDVYIENEYPECIEIHEKAQITLRTTIIAHTRGKGKIIIGEKAFIGCNCVITCPPGYILTIGEGSVLAANSLISTSIPPYTFWGGEKAKPLAKVTVPFTAETSYEDFLVGLVPLKTRSIKKE